MGSFLERAGCWFLHSSIREAAGGVARYYRADKRCNAPVSTEITGYAVSTFVYLSKVTGNADFLQAAIEEADFLTETAWDLVSEAMPFEYNSSPQFSFFFDCGIIIRGLLALYRATGEEKWIEHATTMGHQMRVDFEDDQGRFHPVLSLPSKKPEPRDGRWSRGALCYQLKSALAWWDLSVETGDPNWTEAYETVLGYSLAEHAAFPLGEQSRERTMDRLHAYSYFLEGLLPIVEREDCASALRSGIATTGRLLREIAPDFVRSDVYSQLLRLRLYADAFGVLPLDHKAAAEEAAASSVFQETGADPRLRGGYWFGRNSTGLLPHMNPVSTAFGLQAEKMWRDYQVGWRPADHLELI